METLSINGTQRADVGKKATKAVRRAGLVPCVIYGKGKKNVHFTVKPHDVRGLVYTGEFKLAEIVVDGTPHKCILKTVDFHHVKDTVYHIDFLELEDGHEVKVEVPLRFEGVSPGVRTGGKFTQSVRKIKIKAKPEYLVDEMIADISTLKLGESIRIRDIKAVEGIEILNPESLPVASVMVPRVLKGVEDLAVEGEDETGSEEDAAAEE
ncbi:MAG TPA: 50S ribosomal protein L25 [Bacteroidetes bacterium]|nr:50S ribosomal protein L25 [Bacteroidota bacterium]